MTVSSSASLLLFHPFHALPHGIQRFQGFFIQITTFFFQPPLNGTEPGIKLVIGSLQGLLGIYFQETCQIYANKQQVTQYYSLSLSPCHSCFGRHAGCNAVALHMI